MPKHLITKKSDNKLYLKYQSDNVQKPQDRQTDHKLLVFLFSE